MNFSQDCGVFVLLFSEMCFNYEDDFLEEIRVSKKEIADLRLTHAMTFLQKKYG